MHHKYIGLSVHFCAINNFFIGDLGWYDIQLKRDWISPLGWCSFFLVLDIRLQSERPSNTMAFYTTLSWSWRLVIFMRTLHIEKWVHHKTRFELWNPLYTQVHCHCGPNSCSSSAVISSFGGSRNDGILKISMRSIVFIIFHRHHNSAFLPQIDRFDRDCRDVQTRNKSASASSNTSSSSASQ